MRSKRAISPQKFCSNIALWGIETITLAFQKMFWNFSREVRFKIQCIAQSQKIGIYNPFSIPALKWDLKSNLNPSFKTLVNLNLCLKMGSTIQSRSLFWKKTLHYKRTFCTFSPTVANKKKKMYIQKSYGKTNLTFDCFDKVLFYEFH